MSVLIEIRQSCRGGFLLKLKLAFAERAMRVNVNNRK